METHAEVRLATVLPTDALIPLKTSTSQSSYNLQERLLRSLTKAMTLIKTQASATPSRIESSVSTTELLSSPPKARCTLYARLVKG